VANRGASAAYLTELAKQGVTPANLVKIELPTVLYLTDHTINIDFGGQTYLADGSLMTVPEIQEDYEMRTQEIDIELSGVDLSVLQLFLSQNYRNINLSTYNRYIFFPGRIRRIFNLDFVIIQIHPWNSSP